MKVLLNVEDVQKICDVGRFKAYEIIRDLNKEMKKKGYVVIRGKINSTYFSERLGIAEENAHASLQRG
ncbi:MAG: transcriptional regulator [Cetobacterium sp.]|uniref:transcriptional regulator n=1 Tax=Cetobacterium sp. TaxID=2071632 RepID=UPI003EE53981